MTSDRISDVDRALSEMRRSAGHADRRPGVAAGGWSVARILRLVGLTLFAAVLPFLLLVKLSVYAYVEYAVGAYAALAVAAVTTFGLLVLYTVIVGYRLTGRFRMSKRTVQVVGVLLGVYCCYSLLFISAGNVKSDRVHSVYTQLHPLLRLAVSTMVLVDGDAVVTDAARDANDYARMGLALNERSLHFPQPTGYVHAVDLRTIGRGGLRNFLVRKYFDLMGFNTIRHVGTADHLHVSLSVDEPPRN